MDRGGKFQQPGELIAVVGMACRTPGASDVASYWRLLQTGANAVSEGEPGSGVGRLGELFPKHTPQPACRFAAFVDGIDQFDAGFFRISPVEAHLLDPQQRMMLETSWLALEDAGIDPDSLKGSRTGVFAGISNNEYRGLILGASETSEPAASLYSVTGTSLNTAIGRVAYVMGLEGPAMAIDTACSSSLVAVHQAVGALQRKEADLALAGGVHAILSGRLFELRANAGMLAPDGRCKTFDAAADGYVRAEGCGLLVLKRLSDAEADGDRIWSVIRGSAVNQDGASAGLTVPNGASQERVIEAALNRAGLAPAEVDYVEAHGTGTPVGDPIELRATGSAYGKNRDRPLLIGSVKTNVGHLESAAGAAGLIKVILSLRHGVIPRHLHFTEPTPEVDWDALPLQVPSEATPWPRGNGRQPIGGVSGFGWSGTNAHVLLQAYGTAPPVGADMQAPVGRTLPVQLSSADGGPDTERLAGDCETRSARMLPLSGKSDPAVRALAARYLDWLDAHESAPDSQVVGEPSRTQEKPQAQVVPSPESNAALLADMAWAAGTGRSHFSHRSAVLFRDWPSLRAALAAAASPESTAVARTARRAAFLYTGQGSQWIGMGEWLYRTEPVVRSVLDRCDDVLREDRGASLLDVMFGRQGAVAHISDQEWTQPAIYALECALTALWASLGVRPEVVLGHSLGEFAAAQAAGVFGLEEGLRFCAARGALAAALPAAGSMAAIFAPASAVQQAIEETNAEMPGIDLSFAAYNGAHQVVSGPEDKIEAISGRFMESGVRVSRLRISNAFHSAFVEPMLGDLEAASAKTELKPPSLPLVSNVSGRLLESAPDGAYWREHTRQPVAFESSIATLAELGVDLIVEIGPHAVLGPMASLAWPETADGSGPPVTISSMLRPSEKVSDEDAREAFALAAGQAFEAGLAISFRGMFAGEQRRRIPLPAYPFQRERFWVQLPRQRRTAAGHPLLGTRHDSPRGEVQYGTELFVSDPAWLADHQVYGRVLAPGALYGAMASSAAFEDGAESVVLEDFQLHSALVLPDEEESGASAEASVKLEVLIEGIPGASSREIEFFSRSAGGGEWTQHVAGRVAFGPAKPASAETVNLDVLSEGLQPVDLGGFYDARREVGVELGAAFRTLGALWFEPGQALGEVVLPGFVEREGLEVHPVLLDGCFQVMAAARSRAESDGSAAYLPFGWDRMWLGGPLPDRFFCHAQLREDTESAAANGSANAQPEVLTADLRLYDTSGAELGGVEGYTVKRATRAALLSAVEGLNDLFYEIAWRDQPLTDGMPPADFLESPADIAAESQTFSRYLAGEGVEVNDRMALLDDLESLSRIYALAAMNELGWEREKGAAIDAQQLQGELQVAPEHSSLFVRMLEMLAKSGILRSSGNGFLVELGSGDDLPDEVARDPDDFALAMAAKYAHGSNEIGLFRRSAGALGQVLRGQADPLTLLFSSGEPTAADLYLKAPVARAANRMLGDAVARLVARLPEGRRLRVLEVGAGTGSATASVLPELPQGRFDYVYTDISAGFFAEAEERFTATGAAIDYRPLDIEKDPIEQGFDLHGYDLLIASNVLHATRYLNETLAHCLALLAPSGQLVALENLRGQGWLDLTFGQLDGWWRFADRYRPHHALASPQVWSQALTDAGFVAVEVLGIGGPDSAETPDRGVILAQGPEEVIETPGVWLISQDRGGLAEELAAELAARNQTVVIAGEEQSGEESRQNITRVAVNAQDRDSWRSLIEQFPADAPLAGVVHTAAIDGHGTQATTRQMAEDTKSSVTTTLALVQALIDTDAAPARGLWLLTRGAQVVEKERNGQLAGAALWGFGKVAYREAPQLKPRMLDLDPDQASLPAGLINELLYPDAETHVAYRSSARQAARLVRETAGTPRIPAPEEPLWLVAPDKGGSLLQLGSEPLPLRALEPREVRIAVEAAGLNFWDVFRALQIIEEGMLGGEFCGQVREVGSDVTSVSAGDRVVGLAFGTFGPEAVTHEDMLAPAPTSVPAAALATLPTAFVSAVLSFDLSGLNAGDRVLVHAGAGGVGLAAIQWAQAAGAEVFATASAGKRDYLRSLGVVHVFDSRQTKFGEQVLEATGGKGIDVVLNSLTGEGFIEASLACLANGGRFVELARLNIYSEEEMAAARPDVGYWILKLDELKEYEPAVPGDALRRVMKRLSSGHIKPIIHSRWPMSEAGPAMEFMRAAKHIGKIVMASSALASGRLREDRAYLVTGGLGGIGCVVAEWLAENGAGAIVLNGRRPPDAEAEFMIETLKAKGAAVQVEIADVTDPTALDAMLERIESSLPPLAGVIHSVGVLSDASLANQTWESFEAVLWPKVLGAWHLHRATAELDLDLFVLFSSVAGVLGNAGQANHAAANAFLDQLARHRRSLGLPGQAIAWGAWSGLGEAEEQRERIARQLEAAGTGWITPQQGIKAFEALVRRDASAMSAIAVDWSAFGQAAENHPPMLEDLLAVVTEPEDSAAAEPGDLLSRLRESPEAAREDVLVSFLQREAQAVLRLASPPEPKVGFFDLGMDSLMAVEMRNRMNRAFDGEYLASNTVVFDYPDISALAAYLAEELSEILGQPVAPAPSAPVRIAPAAPSPAPAAPATPGAPLPTAASTAPTIPAPVAAVRPASGAIAIVGMACRFPGAPNLAAFWRHLESGEDAVTDDRPDAALLTGGREDVSDAYASCLRGGFLDGIDQFDARFFRISPIEARGMDPQQRLLLETAWQALDDAAMDPERLRGSRTGVYAGVSASEYRELVMAGNGGMSYVGTARSMAVGRISFFLGLEGPTVPVDLNCAASLVAVHHAVSSLRLGEVNMALAGGVSAILSNDVAREMAALGLLSPEGRTKPFDASADGFARGEGCGLMVLKRLEDAEADGDRIWGVIRGSAVNQNGASAGPTVPNGPAQERVIRQALSSAGVHALDIDFLEAHGGASPMGDPIELQAAGAVYCKGREAQRPLLIGSVKPNIGHLEAAAGVASLIKTVLSMQQGVIPRQLHFNTPSPHVDWDRFPLRVVTESAAWPDRDGRPPRAGVSAFGISGSNCHVVVEGYPPASTESPVTAEDGWPAGPAVSVPVELPDGVAPPPAGTGGARPSRLLPFSGQAEGAVRALAQDYLQWLNDREKQLSFPDGAGNTLLDDMAWTASIGRRHFSHRAAVVFHDLESLRSGLSLVTDATAIPSTRPSGKLVFAYGAPGELWDGTARRLYECEPVAQAVLEQCDSMWREEQGASLLDAILGRAETDIDAHGPVLPVAMNYALQCACTALWCSIGVRPGMVFADSHDALAAGWAAGAFGLEEGLRLAMARAEEMTDLKESGAMEGVLSSVFIRSSALALVSGLTGEAAGPDTLSDAAFWRRQEQDWAALGRAAAALADLGAGVIVEIGPQSVLGSRIEQAWPDLEGHDKTGPVLLGSLNSPSEGGSQSANSDGFAQAVAGVYEAGLPVSFAGLFAGETRRRIGVPGYAFQRKSYWFRKPEPQPQSSGSKEA